MNIRTSRRYAGGGGTQREGRWQLIAARLSAKQWAVAVIVGVVLIANAVYLLDFSDANPLGPRSALAASTVLGPARGQPTIDPNVGFVSQALGRRAALDILHLHFPWWNPYEGTGAPLAGEMQSAAFFPLTWLILIGNGQLYEHVLLEILAGLATYFVLRRVGLSEVAATAGGAAFAVNGTFAWFAHSTINPVAFLPLLLLGIEHAYSAAARGARGGWWLIAVAGALSLYAGFPETAYLDALLAVVWLVWRCGCLERRSAGRLVAKAAAGGLVGTLLSAPLLIAMVDYFNHADLWLHVNDYFSHVHVPTATMPQLVMPYVFGPIFGFSDPKLVLYGGWVNVGGFLSTSLVVLGFIGLPSRRRRGLQIVLAAWIVVMLARIYGYPGFLGDLVNALPGLSNAAVFRYAPTSVEFAVVVLAAIGLDDLIRSEASRRRTVVAAGMSLLVIVIAAIAARPLADQLGAGFDRRPYFVGSVVWAGAVVIAVTAVAVMRRMKSARRYLLAAFVVTDSLLLFVMPELSAPRAVQIDPAPVSYLKRHLGTSRFFTLGPFAPNYGAYYGLASLNASDVPVPKAFAAYVSQRLDRYVDPTAFVGNLGGARSPSAPSPESELLHNLAGYRDAGVAYVLSSRGQPLPQRLDGLTLVARTPTTWIYHLAGAKPYMSGSDPRCTVTIRNRTSAETGCSRSFTLIRRETDMPGWTAAIDGHDAPVGRVDGVFQSVAVPSGRHRVSFAYVPPNVAWGGLAAAVGVLSLLSGVVWRRSTWSAKRATPRER